MGICNTILEIRRPRVVDAFVVRIAFLKIQFPDNNSRLGQTAFRPAPSTLCLLHVFGEPWRFRSNCDSFNLKKRMPINQSILKEVLY